MAISKVIYGEIEGGEQALCLRHSTVKFCSYARNRDVD